jgi:hypothetical protein
VLTPIRAVLRMTLVAPLALGGPHRPRRRAGADLGDPNRALTVTAAYAATSC